MKVKWTKVGDKVDGPKPYREMQAEGWDAPKRAYGFSCDNAAKCVVGGENEVELSENGKYINKIIIGGSAPTGGSGYSKGGYGKKSEAPDPNKELGIYTSYVLEHMIDFKAMKLTPEQAVEQVFKIREMVKGKL